MAKRLFMITKNFPYGSGESFIESEIQVAAKKFEEIIILVYRANLKEKERIVRFISIYISCLFLYRTQR